MITIKQSKNADSRTCAESATKSSLLDDTLSHIDDVKLGCKFISENLVRQAEKHDYTKLQYIDEFYKDFHSGKLNNDFKQLSWWKKHIDERHHLNDKCPDDVNLIDVIEMIVDGCMAGMARSGSVYDIKISNEILQKR